jgi:hypothetical protein
MILRAPERRSRERLMWKHTGLLKAELGDALEVATWIRRMALGMLIEEPATDAAQYLIGQKNNQQREGRKNHGQE